MQGYPTLIKRFLVKTFDLYLDLGSYIFEKTPLKYMGSGFWAEKYAKKSLQTIRGFELVLEKDDNISRSKLEKLLNKTENELKDNDFKMYEQWLFSWSPLVFGFLALVFRFDDFKVALPYMCFMHEFACPSSLRKYRELEEREEYELAEVVGSRASPTALGYFRKRHKNLYELLRSSE